MHAAVELGDAHRRLRVLAADHDAIGMQEVVHGLTLAQELGIGGDRDVLARRARLGEHPLDESGRADGNRRLVDDDRLRGQDGAISRATCST